MPRPNKANGILAPLRHKFGKVPDHEIATESGLSLSTVGKYRRTNNLPAYQGYKFKKGELPDDMPERRVSAPDGRLPITNLLKEAALTSSTSEARRMIEQGAVRMDGERVEDLGLQIDAGTTGIFQVGKRRFARVTVA